VSGSDASRFGFFPSAAITGMLANTGKLPSWISRLNLALEASLTGNSRFSPTYGRNTYEGTNAFELGSIVQKGMANTRITWEKQRQLDFGIDLSLLGGLADLTASVFTNESYDLLLVGRSASSVFGNTSFYDNLGSIRGKGLELGLRLNPIHTKDFDFTLGATFTTVSNKVHSLGGDQQIGAMIAEREIDMLIFFCDNLIVQGHQNDVSALTRLAALYNIAFATNRTTADMLLTSSLLDDPAYEIQIPDVIAHYANRKLK
jgi:outer membrane receptor protein involved in Fe transport